MSCRWLPWLAAKSRDEHRIKASAHAECTRLRAKMALCARGRTCLRITLVDALHPGTRSRYGRLAIDGCRCVLRCSHLRRSSKVFAGVRSPWRRGAPEGKSRARAVAKCTRCHGWWSGWPGLCDVRATCSGQARARAGTLSGGGSPGERGRRTSVVACLLNWRSWRRDNRSTFDDSQVLILKFFVGYFCGPRGLQNEAGTRRSRAV